MRTQKATEARMRKVDQRMADRLASRGWSVRPPTEPVPCTCPHLPGIGTDQHNVATPLEMSECPRHNAGGWRIAPIGGRP